MITVAQQGQGLDTSSNTEMGEASKSQSPQKNQNI